MLILELIGGRGAGAGDAGERVVSQEVGSGVGSTRARSAPRTKITARFLSDTDGKFVVLASLPLLTYLMSSCYA